MVLVRNESLLQSYWTGWLLNEDLSGIYITTRVIG